MCKADDYTNDPCPQLMYVHDVGWQVPVLAALFTALGCGNIVTTSMTIPLKLRDSQTGQLKYR